MLNIYMTNSWTNTSIKEVPDDWYDRAKLDFPIEKDTPEWRQAMATHVLDNWNQT